MSTQDLIENKDALLKEAADLLDVAQRRDDAVKLAFSMVEKGKIPPFENYSSFQEKVASLLDKDLRVVEQALELDADSPSLGIGKVAADGASQDATDAFYHRLADD